MSLKKKYDAVVAGHICLDVRHPDFARQQEIVARVEPGLAYDAKATLKLIGNPLDGEGEGEMARFLAEAARHPGGLSTGGGVSNTGIPLSRLLGAEKVRLVSRVGGDSLADAVEQVLNRTAPGAIALSRVAGETTSYSVVMNDGSGHAMYAHYPGTNDTFTGADLDIDLVARARCFEFSYPPLMKKLYTNRTALAEIFEAVRKAGTRSYLDMHDLHEGTPPGEADWEGILGAALPFVDRFCPSFDEALYLHDRELARQFREDAGSRDVDPELLAAMADTFLAMGAGAVLLKCGPAGLYWKERGSKGHSAGAGLFVPAYPVPDRVDESGRRCSGVVDTTGAGDNAIAAFLAAELAGHDRPTCLKLANAAGFLNVRHRGSVGAFRSMDDLFAVVTRGN